MSISDRNLRYQDLKDGQENYFPEKSSRILTTILTNEDGDPITAAQLSTLTLTLWEKGTGAIVNGRDAANILNTGPGSLDDGTGTLTLTLAPDDMSIVGSHGHDWEIHRGMIDAVLTATGAREVKPFQMRIRDILKVT